MSLRSPTRTGKQVFPLAHFSASSSKDRAPCKDLQPPPLPQKKTVSRAVSSPDGFYWGPASPARAAIPTSPKLNFSQSESNVSIREEPSFGSNLGANHRTFSSSESLEKAFKGSPFPFPCSGKNSNTCCSQNKNLPPRSSSQHSMSTQVSSGSSLQLHNLLSNIDNKEGVYAKLGGLYAESLRRLVSKCEDCFMRDQKSELHFSENNWSLFKLTCNKPCCDSGDAIYYCATCSKDPLSIYAVKDPLKTWSPASRMHLCHGVPHSSDDLPPLPNLSIYSRGLQQLAHLLLEADPIKRIRIGEAKRILQCLLWGPRKDLTDQPLNHEEALHRALHNWIDMKRALLMMKFAERAVDAERKIELEDWLCCQYLASADPLSLSKSLNLLQLL
ncbi:hypothetical protein JD844_009779 [Phrynosoma platyrhinos]|uniref:Uncharacterized protein n=1 Tax=Phrynosoma platyrhinos TaxID=52577 RepID=A0ABQ7TFU3_PHRPL|nr:hypothetical protein JD844_009779 [Phrynosoma platyrhinos]